MSRGGINLATVKQAKEALEARGVYPSAGAVRDHLGTGSLTTINKYLQQLKAQEAGLFGELGLVSQELAGLVLQLHNMLQKQAQETVDAAVGKVTRDFEARLAEASKSLEDATRETDLQRAAKESAQERLITSEALVSDLNVQFNASSIEAARLAAELAAAQNTIKDRDQQVLKLEASLRHSRERLEAFEQAAAEERARLKDAHERELLTASDLIRTQEDHITTLSEQTSDLNVKIGVLKTELGGREKEIDRLTSELKKADARFEQQEAATDELRIAIAGCEARAQILSDQHASISGRYEAKSEALTIAQESIARLTEELALVRQANATAQIEPDAETTPDEGGSPA